MVSTDDLLLQFLASAPEFSERRLSALRKWWDREARPNEGLGEFLYRLGYVTGETVQTFPLVVKGFVRFDTLLQVFDEDKLTALLHLLDQQGKSAGRGSASSLDSKQLIATPSLEVRPVVREPHSGITTTTSPLPSLQPTNSGQHLDLGMVLGRCLLTERIGRGSSGAVYRAFHTGLGIPVAIKVLHWQASGVPMEKLEAFRNEARLLAQVNHPNIVRVLDFVEDPDCPYLILEFVEGLTLAELIAQSGCIRSDRALGIMKDVARGLVAAHQVRIVHRDIKPGNILIARNGTAKLTDFGLAKVQQEGASAGEVRVGTAAYIAPEQAAATGPTDHRADIYSLGATIYHAVTGRYPFDATTSAAMLLKHVMERPRPPIEWVPELLPALSDLLLRMLSKNPEDRPAHADELLQEISRLHAMTQAQVSSHLSP